MSAATSTALSRPAEMSSESRRRTPWISSRFSSTCGRFGCFGQLAGLTMGISSSRRITVLQQDKGDVEANCGQCGADGSVGIAL